MKKQKAVKYRIYPTCAQKKFFAEMFGCIRYIWNSCLALRNEMWREYHLAPNRTEINGYITALRGIYDFLAAADSSALQWAAIDLGKAFKNHFKNPSRFGFPNFKSRRNPVQSYTTPWINNNIRVENGHVRIPKAGFVKAVVHREIPDGYIIKHATVSRNAAGEYYVSLCLEYESQVQEKHPVACLGLDYSMPKLYVDSEGDIPEYPRFYRESEEKLKKEQRRLSQMQKGSNNYRKQRRKVARLHLHAANQRKDFLHKLSRKLADNYDLVCIEDLDMSAMAKALNFGKSVHDNGWGMFTAFLEYKLEDNGGRLQRVDKWFPSSQICSSCGHKHKKVKDLSVREWTCPACGVVHQRDINAAINIREEGKRIAVSSP